MHGRLVSSRLVPSVLLVLSAMTLQGADGSPVRSSSGSITVSATNAPYIRAVTEGEPRVLEITAEDIERGFIDVADAGQLSLQTNHPDGTTVVLSLAPGAILSAEVTAGEGKKKIGVAGGWIDLDFKGTMPQRLPISCRLRLRKDLMPGKIAWPLQVKARMPGGGGSSQ